jgi:hypothetical protein
MGERLLSWLNKWIPMSIRELLGFQKGAPEQVDVHESTWKVFGV